MGSLTYSLLAGAILVAFLLLLYLLDRIGRLEKRIENPSADLLKVINRINTVLFQKSGEANIQATNLQDSLEIIDRIARRIAMETPSLRRVLEFSITVALRNFLAKTGITTDELKGLEDLLAPEAFGPAGPTVIEEWSTHTIIRYYSGESKVFYQDQIPEPFVIWTHALPTREGEWRDAHLEVVIHEGCIKFWALDGRFDRRIPPEPEAHSENVFVVIPLSEDRLADFRSSIDVSSKDAKVRNGQKSWIRQYDYGDFRKSDNFWWNLTITDNVTYMANRY